MTATLLIDCPKCRGVGAVQTDPGSYFGPPDAVPCWACGGEGTVQATRCDVCLCTVHPVVAVVDDMLVCAECMAASEAAETLCLTCYELCCAGHASEAA